MNKDKIYQALEELRKRPKRNFVQSYDLIVNLKDLDLKQNPLNFFATLPFPKGKTVKILVFADQQLAEHAKKVVDKVIKDTEFEKYTDKKELKKIADSYDYFIAQANLMPKVAATFGKVLGIKNKMPNPKLGCIVPPNANLEPLKKKLVLTTWLTAKKGLNLQCAIGKENQPEEEVVNNILAVHNAIIKSLPNETHNIKNILIKQTMGKPVKL